MIDADGTVLDLQSFHAIADLAYRESGLTLVEEKMSMIQSRLRHRLRALSCPNFESYASFVHSEAGLGERKHLISALTTNVSHFFREDHHFDLLAERILKPKSAELKAGNPVRIWSAGCSNGQEAYSIAMKAHQVISGLEALDFRILATDIDSKVVEFARYGTYPHRLLNGVSADQLQTFFAETVSETETHYTVNASLRKLVSFRELNLHADWPMKRPFDAIFCRNVVIYFDQQTQEGLWPRFCNQLAPHGLLFLGHSERIAQPEAAGFAASGPTTYAHLNAE